MTAPSTHRRTNRDATTDDEFTSDRGGEVVEVEVERLPFDGEVPADVQQAKAAARDRPAPAALANLLSSLEGACVSLYDDPVAAPWLEVTCRADGPRAGEVIEIARRAGWRVEDVTWERRRLTVEPRTGTLEAVTDRSP